MTTGCQVCAIAALCAVLTGCATFCRPPPPPPPPKTTTAGSVRNQVGRRPGIVFRNEMGDSFRLTRVLAVLDGNVLLNAQSRRGESLPAEIPILLDVVPPGDHTFQILIQLDGQARGSCGYLRGYKFEVKGSHSLTVKTDEALRLEAIAWEKGDRDTPLEQRPAIRYVEGNPSITPRGAPTEKEPSAGSAH